MDRTWEDVESMMEYPQGAILSKDLFRSGSSNATLFCMAEGTRIGDHTSSKDGMVYVMEGDGEFMLEGTAIRMKPGTAIFMSRNTVHSIKAAKDTSFILYLH